MEQQINFVFVLAIIIYKNSCFSVPFSFAFKLLFPVPLYCRKTVFSTSVKGQWIKTQRFHGLIFSGLLICELWQVSRIKVRSLAKMTLWQRGVKKNVPIDVVYTQDIFFTIR